MNTIVKVFGCVLLVLFLGVILRELGFKGVRLVTLIGTVSILTAGIYTLDAAWGALGSIENENGGKEYVETVMKIIGIGYVSGVCSDVCLEFGEFSLSNSVLFLGKAEILSLCLPCAISIIEKGVEII